MTADVTEFLTARPDAPFLEDAGGASFTYAQTAAISAQFANALAALGAAPGDRVAVLLDKSPHAVFLYLGCLRSGAIYLPLNTGYTDAEVEYFFRDAEPRLVVCSSADRDRYAQLASRCVPGAAVVGLDADGGGTLGEAAAGQPTQTTRVNRPQDTAAILYTSGTTGRSKGAMLTHGNLFSNATTLVEAWRFSSSDVLLHALPIFHVHGLFVGINTVLASGANMIFMPRFDAAEVVGMLARATVFMGVPTFYVRLLAQPQLDAAATRSIRLFVSGSAPLLPATHGDFAERTGHAILERYGMTETLMNASHPYDGDRIPGSVGPALPGVDIRIADAATGAALATGEIGEVELAGPNVFSGYWRNEAKTREAFRADGYFRTGDLGTLDDRGYLRLVGRSKDLIISGGYNVYPKEIEAEIDAMPGVAESAAIGLPHADFGEAVAAVVVRFGPGADEAGIISALSARLARYKVPKRIFFVDELPRNALGKVQKNLLRDRYDKTFD